LFLVALIITASIAIAQVPGYNIGDAMKQAAPPPDETRKDRTTPETPVIVQEEEKHFSLPEGEKIFVKAFNLEGTEKADETELVALLAPYKGRDLTMAEITEAANKLTAFYRNKGYMVAKAYVPKQDATGGILTIRMIMGNYGKFSLNNTSPVKSFFLQGVFEEARGPSPIVARDSLERAMLLVRDMPGAKMPTITVAPGATPGPRTLPWMWMPHNVSTAISWQTTRAHAIRVRTGCTAVWISTRPLA
jgi:hemolysin activation/secretion protein